MEVEPTLEFAGDFIDNTIVLREPISGRLGQSALCHEALHAYLFYNDMQKIVFDNQEEAACYVVNALYYLLTGSPRSLWASQDCGEIMREALPIAEAILSANAVRPNGYTVSPRDFQPLVAAVAKVYPANNSQSSYDRYSG